MALPSMTLAEIRTAAKQRADMVNSSFVSDAEWNSFINGSGYALYDILVASYGEDYFSTTYSFTTDGTSERYALPSGFYKLLGVEVLIASSQYVTLKPFKFGERNRFARPGTVILGDLANLQYRLNGSFLWLQPMAASGQTVRIWYVPQWTALTADATTFDGISGWLDYVVVDAARKALVKEESDTAQLERELAELKDRIVGQAPNRDTAGPVRVTDVYAGADWEW